MVEVPSELLNSPVSLSPRPSIRQAGILRIGWGCLVRPPARLNFWSSPEWILGKCSLLRSVYPLGGNTNHLAFQTGQRSPRLISFPPSPRSSTAVQHTRLPLSQPPYSRVWRVSYKLRLGRGWLLQDAVESVQSMLPRMEDGKEVGKGDRVQTSDKR